MCRGGIRRASPLAARGRRFNLF
uniref:Uncharacterized protein n=1 Tax=Anguilla anguilla TaxID=7936 RepID=A0A0E9T8H9_ANGAN